MTQDIRIRGAIEPNINFLAGASVEVMRIDKNGVTVNPEMALDEVAQYVINALDAHIKRLIQAEREACAKVADKWVEGPERNYSELIADEIRARGQA
jgi:hypothetical protein